MKRLFIIFSCMLAVMPAVHAKKNGLKTGNDLADSAIRAEIAATPEKSGGYYYAYPYSTDSMAIVPDGFKPVYLSHYGRHGSRWVTSSSLHRKVVDVLENEKRNKNLTKAGESILAMVRKSGENTEGHLGELTRLGEMQHAGIARRMIARFPELFAGEEEIIARSSTQQRCIISMLSFTEALKEKNPKLNIVKYASPGDMKFIAYHTKAAKAIYDDPQEWKKEYEPKRDSLYKSFKTAKKIFKNPNKVKKLPSFMKNLQDVAKAVQNVDNLDIDLFQYFDKEDLYNLWKGEDYENYVRHGNSIDGNCEGPKSAANLLNDIIKNADLSLAGKGPKVNLRFGHDIFLMRLLARMDVAGTNDTVKGIDEASRVWQSYRITPMAANIQLTYYRNAGNETIVAIRLNERPVKVDGLVEFSPGFYRWDDLKSKWMK